VPGSNRFSWHAVWACSRHRPRHWLRWQSKMEFCDFSFTSSFIRCHKNRFSNINYFGKIMILHFVQMFFFGHIYCHSQTHNSPRNWRKWRSPYDYENWSVDKLLRGTQAPPDLRHAFVKFINGFRTESETVSYATIPMYIVQYLYLAFA